MSGNINIDIFKVMPSSPHTFNFTSGMNVIDVAKNIEAAMGFPHTDSATYDIFPTAGIYYGRNIFKIHIMYNDNIAQRGGSMRVYYSENDYSDIALGASLLHDISFTVGTGGRTIWMDVPNSTTVSGEVFKVSDGHGDYFLKLKS